MKLFSILFISFIFDLKQLRIQKVDQLLARFNQHSFSNQKLNKQIEQLDGEQNNDVDDPFQVQKEGWLQIQSNNFLDQNRYPRVNGNQPNHYKMVSLQDNELEVLKEFTDNQEQPLYTTSFLKNDKYDSNYFWFRLSKTNLYFTKDNSEMIVMGAINIKNIEEIKSSPFVQEFCFRIGDNENDNWILCSKGLEDRQGWICDIKKVLGKDCEEKKPNYEVEIQKQPVILVNQHSPYCNEDWDFQHNGQDWNCKCQEGQQQSPINIVDCKKITKMPDSMQIEWNPVNLKDYQLVYEDSMIKLKSKDRKHFYEVIKNYDEQKYMANIVDVDYNEFGAQEIWFHTPSDHQLDGKQFAMEIQIICFPITKEVYTSKLIITLLVEKKPEATNEFLKNIDIMNLPDKENPIKQFNDTSTSLRDIFVSNEIEKFSGYFSYYYYNGSLTIPQCDEQIRWAVAKDPIPLSITFIQMFIDSVQVDEVGIDGRLKRVENYRELQKTGDREILYFDEKDNRCRSEQTVKKSFFDIYGGHFEKYSDKVTQYFYVDGQNHSGIENAKQVKSQTMNDKLYQLYKQFDMFNLNDKNVGP